MKLNAKLIAIVLGLAVVIVAIGMIKSKPVRPSQRDRTYQRPSLLREDPYVRAAAKRFGITYEQAREGLMRGGYTPAESF
jgi:hypothetical protein